MTTPTAAAPAVAADPAALPSSADGAGAAGSGSARYDNLLAVLRTALAKSRRQVDADRVVGAVYGADAAIFPDSQLRGLLGDLLDRANEQVARDMMTFLTERGVDRRLLVADRLLQGLAAEDAARHAAEAADRAAANRALRAARLPAGAAPGDVAAAGRRRRLRAERDALAAANAAAAVEVARLQGVLAARRAAVAARAADLAAVGRGVEAVADRGATVLGPGPMEVSR